MLSVRSIDANTNGGNAFLQLNGKGGGYGVLVSGVYCGSSIHLARDSGFLGWSGGSNVVNTPDTRAYRDGAAGAVALRDDTTAHLLRIYGTWSGAGANYERIAINHNGIALESAGTGSANRTLTLSALGTGIIAATSPIRPPSYTVATAPSASLAGAGSTIYVTDESGGAVTATSDGTDWRRSTDRAVIS